MSPTSTPRDDRLISAAWLYYKRGYTQERIAKRFGVSRATVVRMLQTARQQGIVEIEVTRPLPELVERELHLEETLSSTPIRRVVIGDGDGKGAAAAAARRVVAELVTPDDVVGVGWSTTLALIDSMPSNASSPRRVVQLVGSRGSSSGEDGSVIVARIAASWGTAVSTLPVPVFAADAATARTLRDDPVVTETTGWFDRCSLALVGVGTGSATSTMVDAGYLTAEDLAAMRRAGAVADILGWYFDADGAPVAAPWDDRRIGVSLEQLRRIPEVIVVAAGPDKSEALAGAINSGIVTTVVIDRSLAARLEKDR